MTTPTWNQIAAPNFSAGNDLIAQAMEQLSKATTGFKSIADQYKDTIQKRNLGLIQEYVNSAKTPEELQSEAFQTGLTKLTGNMGGDYDTLAKAQLVDKAYDSLLSRKANQVSIASNEFNLDTAKKTQLTNDYTNNILAAPPEQRDALRQEAIAAGAFDFGGVTAGDLAVAQLLGTTQQNKLREVTWDDQVKALKLANDKTEADIANDRRKVELDAKRVENERLKALSDGSGGKGGFSVVQGEEALDGIFKGIRKNQSEALLNIKTKMPYKDMTEVDAEIRKTQMLEWWLPATAAKSKDIINNSPTLSKLPPNVKAAIYKGMVDRITANNIGGKMDWISQDDEKYRKVALDAAKASIGYLLNANTMENALIQDGANKLMRMSNANGGKPVSFEEARAYLIKQLGSSPLNEYKVSNIVLDDLDKEEAKIGEDKLRKASNPVLPQGGFGLQLGGNMVVTQNPVAAQAQPKSINKAATVEATPPQNKSGTSLQQAAITPIVNRLISTPLDIATNLPTVKAKPVADPLRQAASEQTPVATSNTAQPRQLTPTEAAQGERMQQAALSRLIGAKLEEKRAEVQKQFPGTPLKQIAKAATPVPSPLIPVESQNAFRVKENNLTLDFRTGKSTPTKDPVPMPKVTWKEPVQAVTINPIYAQLPQHKVVATFVNDGDTINARSDSYKTKGERARKAGGIICRIDSLEAPETAKPQYGKKGQPYGEEAAKILQQMVLNKEISIRVTEPTDGESNYGRDVCQIEVAGKDVSVELLRAGAVWLYREYNHYGQGGFDLESNARQSKLGLWELPNPVYPPDFRHNGYQNP